MGIRTEACEKWVRAWVGENTVVDSRSPMLFWEPEFPVPAYAFARDDVNVDLLRPASGEPPREPFFHLPKGPVREWYDVVVGDRVLPYAAWIRDDRALDDRIVLSWQPGLFDRWTEEAEEVVEHPRDPHKLVEAIASSRRVQVSVGGVQVADSRRPVLLFETGLPVRSYLPPEDVRLDLLAPSDNRTRCPYKGTADQYWSVPGVPDAENVAWSYTAPLPAVAKVTGLIAFYDEMVDVVVDGQARDRPATFFSSAKHRPRST